MIRTFNISNCFSFKIDTAMRTISFSNICTPRMWHATCHTTRFQEVTITVKSQSCPEFQDNGRTKNIFVPGMNGDLDGTIIQVNDETEIEDVIVAVRNWAESIGQTMNEIDRIEGVIETVVEMRRIEETDWDTWNERAQRTLKRALQYTSERKHEVVLRVISQYSRGQLFWLPRTNQIVKIFGSGNGVDSRQVWRPIETADDNYIGHPNRILMGRITVPGCGDCGGTVRVVRDPERETHVFGDKIICSACLQNRMESEMVACDNSINCQGSHAPMFRTRYTVNVRIPGSRQFLHFCSENCKKAMGFVSCALRSCSKQKQQGEEDWLIIENQYFCCEQHAEDAGYHRCYNCEKWREDNIIIDGKYFCSSDCAIADGWQQCPSCGEWQDQDRVYYCDECEVNYCESCESTHERNHIERVWQIRVREPKKDMTEMLAGEPTFGIELEVGSLPKGPVSEIVPKKWGIHQDGSTNSGYEFVTPPFQMTEWAEMKKTLNKLEQECIITQKEGTHLHVGNWVDPLHAVRFYLMAVHMQETLKQIIAPSRGQNSYCNFRPEMKLKLVAQDMSLLRHWIIDEYERYRAINSCAYTEHGTIEIRCHQGTVNDTKLAKWIELWRNLYLHTIEGAEMIHNCCTYHMLKDLGIGHEYWEARSQVLHPKAWRMSEGNKRFNCGKEAQHIGHEYKVQLKFYRHPVQFFIDRFEFVRFDKTEEIEEYIIDIENTTTMKGWAE